MYGNSESLPNTLYIDSIIFSTILNIRTFPQKRTARGYRKHEQIHFFPSLFQPSALPSALSRAATCITRLQHACVPTREQNGVVKLYRGPCTEADKTSTCIAFGKFSRKSRRISPASFSIAARLIPRQVEGKVSWRSTYTLYGEMVKNNPYICCEYHAHGVACRCSAKSSKG